MKTSTGLISTIFLFGLTLFGTCSHEPEDRQTKTIDSSSFYFGADLSFVNQILDHSGVYRENGSIKDPYVIFKDNGTNLVRVRLWHNPTWTRQVYGQQGTQLYNDLRDVERTIIAAKSQGMQVLLDFHYSDTWADPSKQYIPAAWQAITDINVLEDSVYNYTFNTLKYLNSRRLLPELVQVGNEINCGMLYSEAPHDFPTCNVCNGDWINIGIVVNAAVKAIRDLTSNTSTKTKVLLHVADPKNVEWWFDNITAQAHVTDFDAIGFSYYPLWHTTVSLEDISSKVSGFKSRYGKEVMILETAYPWTASGADNYENQFGSQSPIAGFPYSEDGQYEFMKKLTQELKEGGGAGIIYWEPAWITSAMKDPWGTGSSWENCAFFSFSGEKMKVMTYMKETYH